MTPNLTINKSHEVDFCSLDRTNKQTYKQSQFWMNFKSILNFGPMWADDIRVACMQLAMLLQGVKIDTLPPNRHGSHEVEQELVVSEAVRILFSFMGSRHIRQAT